MDEFMRAALDEARRGAAEGGIPIGAVLVNGGTIVARGHNRRVQDSAPVMHGEINYLYNAGRTIESFFGMTIYSTLMPCHMCAGAIIQFGITRVYAGESETFDEGRELMERHNIEVIDMDLDEAKQLMREFIENKRLRSGTTLSVYNELYHPNNGANYISVYLSPNLEPGSERGVEAGLWKVRLRGKEIRDGRFHAWIERDDPIEIGRNENERLFRFPSFFSARTNVDSHSISSLACGQQIVSVSNLDEFLQGLPTQRK